MIRERNKKLALTLSGAAMVMATGVWLAAPALADAAETPSSVTAGAASEQANAAASQPTDVASFSETGEGGAASQAKETTTRKTVRNGWYRTKKGHTVFYRNGVKLTSQWVKTRWLPTAVAPNQKEGGKHRYWVDAKGHLAQGRFIDPVAARDAGAGYAAYAKSDGTLRTGVFSYKKLVLSAATKGKQKGRLSTKTGFVRKKAGSTVQRFYYQRISKSHSITGARTGVFKVKGRKYLANKRGVIATGGYHKIRGSYYLASRTGALSKVEKAQVKMVKRAKSKRSKTKYLIMVDTNKRRTGVFQGKKGNWQLKKYWICSVGRPQTPTVLGTFKTGVKGYSFGKGFTCYWYTSFYGDYMLHSQTYYQNTFRIKGGKLGKRATHGCVRLDIQNAKWIYDHIPTGSTVVTY